MNGAFSSASTNAGVATANVEQSSRHCKDRLLIAFNIKLFGWDVGYDKNVSKFSGKVE